MDDRFADEGKYKSSLDDFSTLFHEDRVYVGERAYSTGQCVVDILNVEEEELSAQNADLVKTFWTALRKIPVEQRAEVSRQLRSLTGVMDFLRVFQKEIMQIVDAYLEPLERRNSEAYATGIYRFYSDMETAGRENHESPPEHSFPVQVKFVPMKSPTDKDKIILAERTRFSGLTGLISFLEVEFFRGLTVGNAPRRCHNCGKYFLLTAGYNTCYCNNIAPGETTRTCRKVGAHQKALRRNSERTLVEREIYRVYNRLKQRKTRGKIRADEWNALMAQVGELEKQVERGDLTYDELVQRLNAL